MNLECSSTLVRLLQAYGVIPQNHAELSQLQEQFPDAEALAKEIISRGWITARQIEAIADWRAEEEGRRIRIRPSRLLPSLVKGGFILGPELPSQDAFTFVRNAHTLGLFEWITVKASGKKSEAVYATVVTSLTANILIDGLHEDRVLCEMAENKERGWSIISKSKAAKEWESRLTEVATPEAEKLTAKHGTELLERTAEARRAVSEYLSRIDLTVPFSDQVDNLAPNATPQAIERAERLAWGGFRDAEDIYALAWLCIISFEKEVERTPGLFVEQNPYSNPELQDRIYLLVDRLLSSQPERFPTAFPLSRFGHGTKKMD